MTGARGRPAFASDDWMLEQQLRAEMEAEAWRRLRAENVEPAPPQPAPPQQIDARRPPLDPHRSGSAILKGLTRFGIAAFAAYLAYIAGVDSQLGEFEIWLACGGAFAAMLALSMLGPMRDFVHLMAETMRWLLIAAVALGALWVFVQMAS